MNNKAIKEEFKPLLTQPILLDEENFTHNLWGGHWIEKFKGKTSFSDRPVGESWEFSAHPDHPNRLRLKNGQFVSLLEVLQKGGDSLLGVEKAPFLLKLIDAEDDLSVQVHPDNAYAAQHENDSGKAESWMILDCGKKEGEGFIYLGFKQGTDPQKNFLKAISEANKKGPSDDPMVRRESEKLVLSYLNKIKVKPGDTYHIPPGAIHAIGKGVRLFEIQQSSNVTYRVWDWNRPDPQKKKQGALAFRPLHIKQAEEVLDFTPHNPEFYRIDLTSQKIQNHEMKILENKQGGFALSKIQLSNNTDINLKINNRFCVLTCIEGGLSVNTVMLNKGFSVLLPAGVKEVHLQSTDSASTILRSF